MTGFVLKLIAACCMLIDHTAVVLGPAIASQPLLVAMRAVGRIAFPLYGWLIAEGCRHTKSHRRYALRLLLFGLLSEVPYQLAVSRAAFSPAVFFRPSVNNVYFTLLLGVLSCRCYQLVRERGYPGVAALAALSFAALAEALHTDYGFAGVLFIFLTYALPEKLPRFAGAAGVLTLLYLGVLPWEEGQYLLFRAPLLYALYWAGALLSLFFLWYYNGRRGPRLKWGFYLFYPVHLTALYLILTFVFPQFLIVR